MAGTTEIGVSIERFDRVRHRSEDIAAMHLRIRRAQQQNGENRFEDILDSQADLRDVPAAYLAVGGQFFVACTSSDDIVGICGITRPHRRSTSARLQRLAVEPDWRGRGIGTQLVRAAVDWARHRQRVSIDLSTGEQERASGIYRAAGFRVVGHDRHKRDVLMRCDIDSSE